MQGRSVAATRLCDVRICTATVCLAICCQTLASDPAPSVNPDVPFGNYIHRTYSSWHGLPSDTIHDVLQTRDGYLWIATNNGLVKFDGSRFTTCNRSNTPLPSNNVETLYEGRDGTLWIGTAGGLAKRHHAGTFERISALDGGRIGAVFETSEGVLWVGTDGPTWRSLDRTLFQVVRGAPNVVYNYCEDSHATLWIAAETGLYKVTRSGFQAQLDLPAEATPLRILASDDGTMWIGTTIGLFHFHDGVLELRLPGFIWDILQTQTGGLFVIATAALHRLVGDTFEPLTEFESMVCLAEDREGGLWVGKVDGEGLHYYRNQRLRFLLPLGDRRPYCLLEDQQQRMWIGSNLGLHRWQDGELIDFSMADGVPNGPVVALARAQVGSLWIGTGKGLLRWTGTEFISHRDVADFAIAWLLESRDGSLWIGAHHESAIYRLAQNRLDKVARFDASVNCLYEDGQGCLWVGTRNGLFRQSSDGFEPVFDVALDRLGSRHFQCFHADDDGSLWIGTRGGLVQCCLATLGSKSDSFDVFTTREGLTTDYIERLHSDNHGNLWLGGRAGFFSVSKDDLEAVAAGKLTRVRSDTLEAHEMLTHWAVGSRGGPTSCLASDGKLWMSVGLTVATMGDPLSTDLEPPPIYIENVFVDGRTVSLDERVEFLSGPRRLAVEFSAPTFANPSRVRIKHRLEGHDKDWIDAGDERVAHYTNLRPGQYQFLVAADRGDDVWHEARRTLGVTVRPRWWETMLARIGAGCAALGLAVTYFRYRTWRIRKTNVALRREIADRKRAEEESRRHFEQLARVSRAASMGELTTSIAHEVKQPLYAIISNAQTAVRMLDAETPDVPEVRAALSDIEIAGDRATNIIDHIRSLVRKEHHSQHQLDLNAVANDVIKLVDPELRKRGLVIRTEMAETLPVVRGDPVELQQVILNLINNGAQAMSYGDAGPRELLVTTSTNNGSVELAVEDSGVGLSETDASKMFDAFFTTKPDGTGMGLAINRTIIKAHGGRIWATPNPGRGVTFHFSLPISNGEDHDDTRSG